jgi:hypothetical protein
MRPTCKSTIFSNELAKVGLVQVANHWGQTRISAHRKYLRSFLIGDNLKVYQFNFITFKFLFWMDKTGAFFN